MIVLSRNNFLSITQISSSKQQELMKKLNQKKIKWIVREGNKRGIVGIALAMDLEPLQEIAGQNFINYIKKANEDIPIVVLTDCDSCIEEGIKAGGNKGIKIEKINHVIETSTLIKKLPELIRNLKQLTLEKII